MIMNMLYEKSINNGIQKVYKFENGFGASVVQHDYSYGSSEGKWELAVLEFEGDDWVLTYDTPITSDVLGYLDEEEIELILKEIQAL